MNISDEKKEQIKAVADIVEVIGRSVELKKNGKDFFGLCPFHSEKSGSFSVSPEKQMYFCFGCGAGGDVIEYLVKKEGISFLDAVKQLAEYYGIDIEGSGIGAQGPVRTRNQRPETRDREYTPDRAIPPADLWREKAEKLVSWAHENLLNNSDRLAWLAARGIDIGLVREFMLGWNPGENGKDLYRPRESWGLETVYKDDNKTRKKLWIPVGYIIPLVVNNLVERIRIRTERDQPKYYVMPGSGMRCLVPGGACRAYVIIESELDAIMVYGKIRINKIGVVALGSAQRHPELGTYELLKKVPVILNALDFDQAGRKALEWWEERFPDSHKRWPVPAGKDPGDAYKAGIDIPGWVRAGLPEAWNWEVKGSRIQGFEGSSETFGRSDLLIDKKEGQAESTIGISGPLKELAALIKSSPVVLWIVPGNLKIIEPPSWPRSNPEKSRRISELVFMVKEVRSFLMSLGNAELNRLNIEDRISEIEKEGYARYQL